MRNLCQERSYCTEFSFEEHGICRVDPLAGCGNQHGAFRSCDGTFSKLPLREKALENPGGNCIIGNGIVRKKPMMERNRTAAV